MGRLNASTFRSQSEGTRPSPVQKSQMRSLAVRLETPPGPWPRRPPAGRPRQLHRAPQPSMYAGPGAGGDGWRPLTRCHNRRPRRLAVVGGGAPSARAASLASSAALPRPPGDGLTRPDSGALTPTLDSTHVTGVRPCWLDGGSPLVMPLGGVERPRRLVRFARLIHRRGRVLGGPSSAPSSAAV